MFATLVVALVGYQMMPSHASSHREAPLISSDPQADTTDVYAFVSPDDPNTVTLISSWIPFEDPQGGPNFYRFGDNVLYEFKIDNNGDGVEDITYQFRFTSQVRNPNTFLYNTGPILGVDNANRNMFQTYTVTRIDNGRTTLTAGPMTTMYDNVGPASAPQYGGRGAGVNTFNDVGGTSAVFAGQTDDPFFLDLRVFDLLYGANLSEAGVDSLAGFNVHSLALRVPKIVAACGQPDHRRVGHREPSDDHDAHAWFGNGRRQLRSSVAPRHAARERGRDSRSGRRTSGTAASRPTTVSSSATSRIRKCPSCCRRSTTFQRLQRHGTTWSRCS